MEAATIARTPRNAQFFRTLLIAAIVLLMLIPIGMIENQVLLRQVQRNTAVADITQKWGAAQTLTGPHLVLPYRIPGKRNDQGWLEPDRTGNILILPTRYTVDAVLHSELRYRSIYAVPLYRAEIAISGDFDLTGIAALYGNGERQLLWDEAVVNIGVSDPKGVRGGATLVWAGTPLALAPGVGRYALDDTGFHADVLDTVPTQPIPFTLNMTLAGHDVFQVVPLGRESTVNMHSNWGDPSFQGNWLPSARQVDDTGFSADWQIPFLGRNFPEHWEAKDGKRHQDLQQSAVGVQLTYPLDTYGKTRRSTRYALLFIGLTFVSFWLFELLCGIRIHPMQYLLVGVAMSLFYLLLLSLAEHLGFYTAYILAALTVVATITAYSITLVRQRRRVILVGVGLGALYAYLLALLQEQEYALLAGSLGLFAVLGAVMYLTRNVDWFAPMGRSSGDE